MLDGRLKDCPCFLLVYVDTLQDGLIVQLWKSLRSAANAPTCLLPYSKLIVIYRRQPSKFMPDWDRHCLNNDFLAVSASLHEV